MPLFANASHNKLVDRPKLALLWYLIGIRAVSGKFLHSAIHYVSKPLTKIYQNQSVLVETTACQIGALL